MMDVRLGRADAGVSAFPLCKGGNTKDCADVGTSAFPLWKRGNEGDLATAAKRAGSEIPPAPLCKGGNTKGCGGASAWLLLALFTLPAWGHGDEDHSHEGDKPAAAAAVQANPRGATASEEFELVAALEGRTLTLYLDRYASNEPVAKAQVEVESGPLKAVARETAPGVYTLPGERLAAPGKHALVITVQAGEVSDLLTATLVVPPPAAAAVAPEGTSGRGWLLGGGAALLLAVTGGLWMRRKR
jgi:hypothetical protein